MAYKCVLCFHRDSLPLLAPMQHGVYIVCVLVFPICRTAVKQQAIFHVGREPHLESALLSSCLRHCWSAHSDAVASLQVTVHPKAVVTCGFDKRVCVWSWKGGLLGSLKQRNVVQKFVDSQVLDLDGTGTVHGTAAVTMDKSWTFKPDVEGRHNGLHSVAKRAAFEVRTVGDVCMHWLLIFTVPSGGASCNRIQATEHDSSVCADGSEKEIGCVQVGRWQRCPQAV
jgi:hypothetical protein